ncbi:MAG: hypothetical protein ACE5EK_04595 [Nitrospinales bacterium]
MKNLALGAFFSALILWSGISHAQNDREPSPLLKGLEDIKDDENPPARGQAPSFDASKSKAHPTAKEETWKTDESLKQAGPSRAKKDYEKQLQYKITTMPDVLPKLDGEDLKKKRKPTEHPVYFKSRGSESLDLPDSYLPEDNPLGTSPIKPGADAKSRNWLFGIEKRF